MNRTIEAAQLWMAALAIAVFGAASVASFRPPGRTDRALALSTLRAALAALDDDSLPPADRIAVYRDRLMAADALLRRTLRSNPTDTASIERLALVRWELGVVSGTPSIDAVTSLMNIAAERAPRVPDIQVELGELLYRMGREDDAGRFMAQAVTLAPMTARRVVAAMLAAGITPDAAVHLLPPVPEVLVAIKDTYLNLGLASDFAGLAEAELPRFNRELITAYGDACIRGNFSERLVKTLEALGPYADPQLEAERARQLARGFSGQDRWEAASAAVLTAIHLFPDDYSFWELRGNISLSSGDPVSAEEFFRKALALTALTPSDQWTRPRLYGALGLALDAQGRVDSAIDSYRRALELNPSESVSSARLRAFGVQNVPPRATRPSTQ
jgi:tetratricopeptide (TPR) repeat protein